MKESSLPCAPIHQGQQRLISELGSFISYDPISLMLPLLAGSLSFPCSVHVALSSPWTLL